MKMTISEEPLQLVLRDFEAHAASGRAQVEAMRQGTATYKGLPIKFGYLPKYFSEEGFEKLKADLECAWRILVRVIEEYLDHADYRALFGFAPDLEEMILRRPAYRTLLPVCRLDIFLNEETGDFKFCEFNADGSSAMNENAELYRTYPETLLYRQMEERYEQQTFELFDSWVKTFLEIYAEAKPQEDADPSASRKDAVTPASRKDAALQQTGTGESRPADTADRSSAQTETGEVAATREALAKGIGEKDCRETDLPVVAIVDFLEKGSSSAEFEAFRQAFARAGCPAYIAEIRDLRYEDGRLLTPDGHAIDAVYRRAVTSDILAHREEVQAFLEAARDRKVCLIGDFCTQVVHDKVLFRILHDPRTAAFLSEEENAYIAAHVPYTAMLTKETAARQDVRGDKDRWILKPRDSYGAHGIYPGRQCTEEEWNAQLDARADTDYILQEFVTPFRTDNINFGEPGAPVWQSFSNMTGIYLYGGRLAGIYSRASVTPIISVEGDEHEMTSIILKPRKK